MAPLLFKAWRESRDRFLLSAGLLATLCVAAVFFRGSLMKVFVPGGSFVGAPYVGYIYRIVYGGMARGLFTLLAMVLALGGLSRERLQRTVGFTLALPVCRARLVGVQALAGLMQVALLSVLPLLVLAVSSRMVHLTYPLGQMARFCMLWFAGGSVFFALAFLLATLFHSEYTALAVSLVFSIFYPLLVLFPPLSRFPLNVHHIMSGLGMPYFDARHALLTGAPPWELMASMLAVAGVLVLLSLTIASHRDYP